MWLLTSALVVVAIGLILLLYIVKNKKKAKQNNETSETLKKIKGTNKKVDSAKESLEHLSKLADNFFKSYLGLKGELTFKEMSEILNRKKEESLADFCEKLDFYLYSGKEITKQESVSLIDEFIKITKTHKIREKKIKKDNKKNKKGQEENPEDTKK